MLLLGNLEQARATRISPLQPGIGRPCPPGRPRTTPRRHAFVPSWPRAAQKHTSEMGTGRRMTCSNLHLRRRNCAVRRLPRAKLPRVLATCSPGRRSKAKRSCLRSIDSPTWDSLLLQLDGRCRTRRTGISCYPDARAVETPYRGLTEPGGVARRNKHRRDRRGVLRGGRRAAACGDRFLGLP